MIRILVAEPSYLIRKGILTVLNELKAATKIEEASNMVELQEALEYTPRNETKIVLIDGEQLAQLMIDYNLGCTTQQTYELKKIDSDYFGEE